MEKDTTDMVNDPALYIEDGTIPYIDDGAYEDPYMRRVAGEVCLELTGSTAERPAFVASAQAGEKPPPRVTFDSCVQVIPRPPTPSPSPSPPPPSDDHLLYLSSKICIFLCIIFIPIFIIILRGIIGLYRE